MWWMCTPALPAGCGPRNTCRSSLSTFSTSGNSSAPSVQRWRCPSVRRASACSPVRNASSEPRSNSAQSAASGAVSTAGTKMSRGATVGSGATASGRWVMAASRPLRLRASSTWPRSADASAGGSSASASWRPSDETTTFWMARRAPRSTSATVPETGEVNRKSSCSLSWNRGEPIFTASPGCTSGRAMMPRKSGGLMATADGRGASMTASSGRPARRMSCPRLIVRFTGCTRRRTRLSPAGAGGRSCPEVPLVSGDTTP